MRSRRRGQSSFRTWRLGLGPGCRRHRNRVAACKQDLHRRLEAAQNLLPAQILLGEETRGTTHFPAQGGICGERENGVLQTGGHLLELRTEGAIAAKDKMQAGIVLQLVRKLRQYVKTLFYAEISGVEQHDPVVADTKLAADLVWCVEGADGIDIDP